jgi:CHAT domain-containing protein/lipopolysaccharide biosynthesis regulator YciM
MPRGAVSIVAAVLLLAAAPVAQQATALALRVPVERALAPGGHDAYVVELREGECATITVDQHGVDVVIRTTDSSGATIAEIDDETHREGRERFTLVADASGETRFTISNRYAKFDPGTYTVRVDEIRPATDADRALYEARWLSTDSLRLRVVGKFDDALDRATRAEALGERALGPKDPFVGTLVWILAGAQRAKGDSRSAEQSYLRAIDIYQAAFGRVDPRTAYPIQHLADVYNEREDFAKAEPLFTEAFSIVERTLGEHPRLAMCLMDMAGLHLVRQDTDRALDELKRADAINKRWLSPDDVNSISVVHNIGDVYIRRGEYDRAEPYVEQSLADIERTQGKDSVRVANPLLNLAIVARERGDYPRALEYIQRAYDVSAKSRGTESVPTASYLITLGNVYNAQGDYPRALETYQRAYEVLDRVAGPYHSFTLMTMANWARTYAAAGNPEQALEMQSKYDALVDKTIIFNLAIGSERDRLTYLESTFEKMGRTITLNLIALPDSAAAANLAASAILRRKGRVLDAIAESRETLRTRLDADDQKLLDDYGTVTKQLSQLALSGPGRTPPAAYRTHLDDLERDRDALEGRMAARSAQFRADREPVSLDVVRAAIPADAALLEFIVYEPFHAAAKADKDAHDPPHYAAYVIRHDTDAKGVDLGPVADIDAAVGHLRGALRDPARTDVSQLSRRVDRLVMQPLRARLGTAKQLLIVPDGALNLIPFEALVDERGRFQVERYAMSYLGSGRDILRMQVARATTSPAVVIADPAFGEPPVTKSGPVYFAPLDGTRKEAEEIGRLLPEAVVLTGSRATKTALERMGAPSILHIASHAFFLPENGAPVAAAVADTRSMTTAVQSSNPLLRSGIALAGANLSRPGDPGILTALEASTLNLWGTRLVTLSACDTGVGDVKTGEGVYGLRRAFFVAGAESLVMSLWPISDQVTRSVMTRYYAGLTRGDGRAAALRRVQLAMLADKNRHHPFYWAGFIEAGDWTPIR